MFERWERQKQILTGVELGTRHIKVAMGEILPDDSLSVVGLGEVSSQKIMKGEVCDANEVMPELARALAEAEKDSGFEAGHVFMAMTGGHIHSLNSIGSTPVQSQNAVSEDDIVQAVQNARGYVLPADEKVLHFLDRRYILDGVRETSNPEGLVASKLESEVHLIYGHHNRVESSCRIVTDVLGYPPTDVAFSGVAAASAVVTPEDTEKGVLVIDLGAGCTEYVIFQGAGCFHSGQVTVGCEHIANDLSIGLGLPIGRARQVLYELEEKRQRPAAQGEEKRMMVLESTAGQEQRRIPASEVERIVDLRLEELFDIIREDLHQARVLDRIGGGAYLAGGGARIPGITGSARERLGMPVGMAEPHLFSGDEHLANAPEYLVPFGLIRWGQTMLDISQPEQMSLLEQLGHDMSRFKSVVKRAFNW